MGGFRIIKPKTYKAYMSNKPKPNPGADACYKILSELTYAAIGGIIIGFCLLFTLPGKSTSVDHLPPLRFKRDFAWAQWVKLAGFSNISKPTLNKWINNKRFEWLFKGCIQIKGKRKLYDLGRFRMVLKENRYLFGERWRYYS